MATSNVPSNDTNLGECRNSQVSSISVRVLEVLKALGHTLLQKGQKRGKLKEVKTSLQGAGKATESLSYGKSYGTGNPKMLLTE